MSNAKDPWFVVERSRALASLLLTSRPDVRVLRDPERDDGVDLWVEITTGDALSARVLVVQLKGTTSSDPNDWMQTVSHLFPANGSMPYLPACVFVVDVRGNRAFYAWVAEPAVGAEGATLRVHERGDFRPLDAAAVDQVIDQVKAYYDALPRQLQPA